MYTTLQLAIFCIVSLLSLRGIADEMIYMLKKAPKTSQFRDRTHILSWLGAGSSLFFVMNGMSYL